MAITGSMYDDRVLETLASGFTGTGTFNLGGAVTNAQTFVGAFGTGNKCYYIARKIDSSKWEEGWGVITDATPDTLTRVEVFKSFDGASYGTSKIDWAASDTVIIYSAPLAANGGLSGWQLIEDASLSSVASYIKDSISSRFNWLRVTYSLRPATDAATLSMVLRKASGTDITSYALTQISTSAGATNNAPDAAASSVQLAGAVENTSPQGVASGEIWISNIQSSDYKSGRAHCTFFRSTADENALLFSHFQAEDAAAITGIKILFSSGNIAAGRARVEGC